MFIVILCAILDRYNKKGVTMKRFLIAAAIAIASLTTTASAADVGVSISIGQPGFYGQLNIGDFPQPSVIYAQPMIIDHRSMRSQEPIYLRVPQNHYRNWNKYCHKYNACNRRVYFVHDNWYRNEYAPRYREKHQDRRNDRMDNRRNDRIDDRRDDRRDDRQDDRQGDNRGNDHGNQKNKDKGHGNDR